MEQEWYPELSRVVSTGAKAGANRKPKKPESFLVWIVFLCRLMKMYLT
jgi:hypothetical protein